MTYRQIIEYYEDGFGLVNLTFIISDSKAGLSSLEFTEIDLVNLNDVKKSIEISTGVLSEDEATFEMEEIFVDNTANNDAKTFILESLDASIKRFVAIHLHNAGDTADVSNLLFYGIIVPNAKADDLHWVGADYSTSSAPIRKWSFTVRPLATTLLDNVFVKQLINLIPAEWWTANVSDRQAYFNNGTISSRFSELINLNLVIQKVCEMACGELSDLGLGTYTIECPTVETNCLFRPTRYLNRNALISNSIVALYKLNDLKLANRFDDKFNIDLLGSVPRFYDKDWKNLDTVFGADEVIFCPESDTDTRKLKLGFDTIDNDNSPYVSQRVFFDTVRGSNGTKSMPNEFEPKSHKDSLCYGDETTLTEWLFTIAYNFGFFLKFDYEDNGSTLVVGFEPRIQSNTQTYLSDVISASLETNFVTEKETERDGAIGNGFYWTAEFTDAYIDGITPIKSSLQGNKKIYFTLSPNFYNGYKMFYTNRSTQVGFPSRVVGSGLHPHNFKYVKVSDGTITTNYKDTTSVHTAIYMKVSKFDVANDNEAEEYFTTAGQVVAEQNGAVVNYNSMAGYLNGLVVFDKTYYKTQYSLSIPYLMQFSDSNTGINKDFAFLQLLNNIVIDGVTYKVVDITYNLKDFATEITLHNSSRFSFADTISEMPVSENSVAGITFIEDQPITNAFGTAFEFEIGNVVFIIYSSISEFSSVHKAQPLKSKYEYKFGIALNNTQPAVSESEYSFCLVAFDGETVEIDYLPTIGSVGDTVYLKYTTPFSTERNLTTDLPSTTPIDGEQVLWCEVGKIIEPTKLLVNIKKWIIE